MDETSENSENTGLNILIISAGSGAGVTATKLLSAAGHNVATTTNRGSEGSAAIRKAGGLSLHIDPQRAGEVLSMINMHKADVIVNFGGLAATPPPYARPDFAPEMVVINAQAIFNAVRGTSVKHIIHASSALAYGDTHGEPAAETAKLNGSSKVAETTRQAEAILTGLDIPVTILRAGFVYGSEEQVLKDIYENLRTGRPVFAGTDKNTLPWTYAGDLAQATALVIEKEVGDQIFNVTDDAHATPVGFMGEFANGVGVGAPGATPVLVSLLTGNRALVELTSTPVRVDNTKIKSELGWEPQFATRDEAIDQILLDWRVEAAAEMLEPEPDTETTDIDIVTE